MPKKNASKPRKGNMISKDGKCMLFLSSYAKPGHQAHRNTHLGFIKLGSRVDMYLPLDTEMFVTVGEAVRGNETIIGRLNDQQN